MNANFQDLIAHAYRKSTEFYSDIRNKNVSNPYYIGTGNPDSKILIVGKELGFDPNNLDQLKRESVYNPEHWQLISDKKWGYSNMDLIQSHFKEKYANQYTESVDYFPLLPYYGVAQRRGHTWNYYQMWYEFLHELLGVRPEKSFHYNSFITEFNARPSKLSPGKNNIIDRSKFLKHPFYQSFDVVLLAFGNYSINGKIEDLFDVKWHEDLSVPYERLVVYKSDSKIVLNTRQFSNSISNSYIEYVADIIKSIR